MQSVDTNGSIDMIDGGMFAGKSTEVIRRIKKLTHDDIQYGLIVVKHSADDRYSATAIVTHAGVGYNAVPMKDLNKLIDIVSELKTKYVFIDEGQFYVDLCAVCLKLKSMGCKVTAAGLNYDFKKEWFPSMKALCDIADTRTTLKSVCRFCKGEGLYSKLLIKLSVSQEVQFNSSDEKKEVKKIIGGDDMYAPVCEKCYDL